MIITLSREIESLMTQLGANEAGLHDKTDHLSGKLSKECVDLLHYIAAVRNKNAHEVTDEDDFNMELFTESCEVVMNELQELLATEKNIEIEPKNLKQETYEVEDVDKTFSDEFKSLMKICAYLPLFNVVFFIYKILSELFKAFDKLAGVVFHLMSLIIMVGSLLDKNEQYFYCGAILFGGVYLYGIILTIINRHKNERFKEFAYIPILNLGYFIYGCYEKCKIFPVLYYAVALVMYGLIFVFYYRLGKLNYAIYCGWICYLMGVAGALFDIARRKIKKN